MAVFAGGIGTKTWVGIGKETTFNTAVSPTLYHACESNSPSDKIGYISRSGPRGIGGQTLAAPGPVSVNVSLKAEPDPDTIMQLLAYAMGTQSSPAHPSGSSVAYTSTLSFGTPRSLPSFTMEYFRDIDDVYISGCAIDSMKLSLAPGQKLGVDLSIVGAQSAINGSASSPTFSTTSPLQAENTGSSFTYNATKLGVAGQNAVRSWNVSLANNLDKNHRTIGSQYVTQFPLGQRKVSGSFTLDTIDSQAYTDFLAQGTTPLTLVVASGTLVDGAATPSALYYSISISLPVCRFTDYTQPQKTGGPQDQTVQFEAFRDTTNSKDDMQIVLTNLASAAY